MYRLQPTVHVPVKVYTMCTMFIIIRRLTCTDCRQQFTSLDKCLKHDRRNHTGIHKKHNGKYYFLISDMDPDPDLGSVSPNFYGSMDPDPDPLYFDY